MNEQVNAPAQLRYVITLLLVNLALSVVLAILFVVFQASLIDHQIAHLRLPAGADVAGVRAELSAGLWSRVAVVVVIGVVYSFLIRQLREGRRRAYRRVLVVSVVSLVGITYLLASAQYPGWVRVEQVVQAVVLVGLLWATTRPAVRAHFALRPVPTV